MQIARSNSLLTYITLITHSSSLTLILIVFYCFLNTLNFVTEKQFRILKGESLKIACTKYFSGKGIIFLIQTKFLLTNGKYFYKIFGFSYHYSMHKVIILWFLL